MIRSFCYSIFLLVFVPSFAQDTINKVDLPKLKNGIKHELKVGLLKPFVNKAVEATYECIITNRLGFGISTLVNFDKTNSYQEDLSITPFSRFYIQNPNFQFGSGFFLEGFGKYVEGRYKDLNDVDVKYKNVVAGIGAGYKYLFKNGLIIEPMAGFSQAIVRRDTNAPTGGLRADIAIGYRF